MYRKYSLEDNFFTTYTDLSCYWAGFLAADGCILSNGNYVSLELNSIDLNHIQKFHLALCFTGPITYKGNAARLQITSDVIVHDLINNFNITRQKTFTLQPPNLNTEDHIRSFIRGYIDGDGSIWFEHDIRYKKPQYRLSMAGTESMLEWIKYNIQKYVSEVGNPSVRHLRHDCEIKQLVFGGQQVKKILEWLYSKSTNATRLDRKYIKYQEVQIG